MGWWSLTLKHSDLTDHKDPSKLIWLLHRLLFPGICTSLPASSVYPSAKRSKHRSSHSINTVPLSTGTIIHVPSAATSLCRRWKEEKHLSISCQGRHKWPKTWFHCQQIPQDSFQPEQWNADHKQDLERLPWQRSGTIPEERLYALKELQDKQVYISYTYIFTRLYIYVYTQDHTTCSKEVSFRNGQ